MEKIEEDGCVPIAVIGMGCRFPGDATSPDHLWDMLVNGRNAWSEIPQDRINVDGFYHPSGDRQGSICFKGGHFLRDDVAAWDAPFFSTTAHEAAAMDPQQRILLEVSYEAFENAGIPMETLPGSQTAVYCGSFVKDYEQICLRDPDDSPQYAATGNGIAIMSNRVSWFYDLHGPSMTLDTGCSASLVGIHLACQSLRTGESTMAIAMGAGLILTPSTMLPMTALNFLSPDGKCFAFDERANGYGRGEGIGAVVLKPLADALRDNDTIRAVIRGSGVNQDGRTPGITMPSKEAQAMNIKAVYKAAKLGYNQTAYFEAHGTGTQAGDPTELGAISETFAETRDPMEPIFVGSVKTNIGHLEGCAGIAGLVKGVLMLEKGLIPPNLYFENVNPRIDLDAWRIRIPKSVIPWPMDGLRRASINCFGFGGTNAHIILDDALHYLADRNIIGNHNSIDVSQSQSPATIDSAVAVSASPSDIDNGPTSATAKLFVLSSHEQDGVGRLSSAYSNFLAERENILGSGVEAEQLVSDLAYTLASRRSRLPWKAFVVSKSPEKLASQLLNDLSKPYRSSEAPNVAFVFSGQGAQWFAMGRELVQYQVFRESLEEAEVYLHSIGSEWVLISELLKDEKDSIVNLPHISQPLCTALQVALVDLLKHWAVQPFAVVGHSSGEIAAAYAFGAISRSDAWKLAFHRGRWTSAIKSLSPNTKGRMMVVASSQETAETFIGTLKQGTVIVACINSPENVTVSGDESAILELQDILSREGVFTRILKVETAYHSFHMKIIEDKYLESIRDVQTQRVLPGKRMFSSVTGESITAAELGPSYWARNLVSPVRFSKATQSLLRSRAIKVDVLLEIGPHAVLQAPLKQILDAEGKPKSRPSYISMLYRNKDAIATSLEAAGSLYSLGSPIDLAKVNSGTIASKARVLTDLPSYPWNHTKTYWHESHLCSSHRFRKWGRQDLVGAPTAESTIFEPRWRGFIRVSENPWVIDHQVQNTIIYPAAGMISMVLEAAQQVHEEGRTVEGYEISKMNISKAMIIPNTAHGLETGITFKIHESNHASSDTDSTKFEFSEYSKILGAAWIKNCDGLLTIHYKSTNKPDTDAKLASIREYKLAYVESQKNCTETLSARQLYETLESIGMKYGPKFQNITSVSKKDNQSCTTIRIPDTKSTMPAKFEFPHLIHPATLDAMFQTVFVAGNEPMVPSYLENLFISADFPRGAGKELKGYSSASRRGLRDATGNIVMSENSWRKPLLVVKDLHFTAISTTPENFAESGFLPNHHKLCAELTWKETVDTTNVSDLSEWLALLSFKNPDLSILEIGGQHEPVVSSVLEVLNVSGLTPRLTRYVFASETLATMEDLQVETDKWSAYVQPKTLKLQDDLDTQGFRPRAFDLIISSAFDTTSLHALKTLLKSKGRFLLLQPPRDKMGGDGSESGVSTYRIIEQIKSTMFDLEASFASSTDDSANGLAVIVEPTNPLTVLRSREVLLILPDVPSPEIQTLSGRITGALQLIGTSATSTQLLGSPEKFAGKICVALLEIDAPLVFNWSNDDFDAFRSMISLSKGCLWITKGGHIHSEIPFTSPIATLFRTIRSEDPKKSLFTLDLDTTRDITADGTGAAIMAALIESFNSTATSIEMEYAVRDDKLLIPRAILQQPLSAKIERGNTQRLPRAQPFFQLNKPLQLKVGTVGNLDSICFGDDSEPLLPLGSHEVEIRVEAASVSSHDVQTALGQTSSDTFGSDVSGIVTSVGSSITKFQVGARVTTIVQGAFKTFVRSNESTVQQIPDTMSFEIAASLPSDLIAAYYSVVTVGRLQAGESILIHPGTSGFGQAAIQIANHIGARIFATIGGIKERKHLSLTYGITDDHLFDYGSAYFGKAIRRLTHDEGVDLILNNFGPQTLDQVWSCISEFGRFVDIRSNAVASVGALESVPPLRNVSYSTVDIEHMFKKNLPLVSRLLQSAFAMVHDKTIREARPLYIQPVSQILDAFKEAQARTYGKVILKFNPEDLVPAIPHEAHPLVLNSNATYILVGGLGGLGRSLAGLLVEHGAKYLAFISRSGGVSDDHIKFLADLRRQGVDARAYACDICDRTQLVETVQKCASELPKIRGVIQGAAVIRDAIFENMTYDDWVTATRPKMQGSWNLHETLPEDMDFFVFLSSSAGAIGARGQANYNSGNGFQDALAHYRRNKGMAAVSLDLGPILGVGMVAEDEATLEMLRASGFFGIREKDFHILVSAAMTGYTEDHDRTPAQVITGTGTGGLVQQNGLEDPYWYAEARMAIMQTLDTIPKSSSSDKISMQELLSNATSLSEAASIVLEGLVTLLAKAMNMLPGDLDTRKPANAYGVDSLVAVGTRNWIFREMGVDVSVFEILSENSIADMAGAIVGKCRFLSDELRAGEEE